KRSCRETARRRDDAGRSGRIVLERGADRREREVAERAVAVPVLESGERSHLLRLRARVELERLEPLDPRIAVTRFAAPLCVVEVVEERLRVALVEAERPQALERLVRPHDAARPDTPGRGTRGSPSRVPVRCAAGAGRDSPRRDVRRPRGTAGRYGWPRTPSTR